MGGWDWNAIYLTCFGIGLVLSFAAFFLGGVHLHPGHVHIGGHGLAKGAVRGGVSAAHSTTPSIFSGFTLMAFLCWFGGTGYMMHRANVFGVLAVLLFAAVSGMAGASLIFWFLARVLAPAERTLEDADTEMAGVIGRLSTRLAGRGFGEMLYTQNGARRSTAVRSDDGGAIERDAEVIVMRYERGVAYVRRWDEFEHSLLRDGVGGAAGEGFGSDGFGNEGKQSGARETAQPE
jgi:hypothetical protein